MQSMYYTYPSDQSIKRKCNYMNIWFVQLYSSQVLYHMETTKKKIWEVKINSKILLPPSPPEKEIDEIEKEAEFYSIKGLLERCKHFKQHDSFSEDFVQVIECAYWGRVMRQEDRLDSMAKEMNVDEKFHNSEGTPVLKVPLMEDGTLSLSFLRKMFPSANGLCLDVGFKPGEIYEALKIVGDSIHPPKSGWNDYTYFTLPIKVDEKFMNTIL